MTASEGPAASDNPARPTAASPGARCGRIAGPTGGETPQAGYPLLRVLRVKGLAVPGGLGSAEGVFGLVLAFVSGHQPTGGSVRIIRDHHEGAAALAFRLDGCGVRIRLGGDVGGAGTLKTTNRPTTRRSGATQASRGRSSDGASCDSTPTSGGANRQGTSAASVNMDTNSTAASGTPLAVLRQ